MIETEKDQHFEFFIEFEDDEYLALVRLSKQ
jgi:hypothetical protein